MSQVKTVKIKDGDDFRVINESDFKYGQHELCEGEKLSTDSVLVNFEVGITPEPQATIDQAKAECEKVVAENVELKQQIETLKADLAPGEPADLSGLVPVEQFDAVAQKLVEAEDQLSKEREAVKKLTSENEALKVQVKDLEAKAKKPTAAELKAAKAAEEAKTAEQTQE